MPDYRSMYDRSYLGHWDLMDSNGKPADVTLTIAKVIGGELHAGTGTKTKKAPVVHFEGKELGLVLNKTNGKTIATLYGPKVEAWVGKRITLYQTTTNLKGETVGCVRVRPQAPK